MCGSNNCGNNACCPLPQFFQEKICGNFTGPLDGTVGENVVWSADGVTDYIQGTFEIFVSSGTLAQGSSIITQATGGQVLFDQIDEGNTQVRSAAVPTSLVLNDVNPGDTGRFCITLYKRILP
ncbi:endospore appendages protein [Cytobacillus horneckiae]|uniref:Endospore appendages core domain-containing protein n=1 Tax=Cytobacillus horneckiae TaxID=549687 RepID=A0A2N0ZD25_9BACI|nr:S-Ena type endospore appendage [Cytobacillus horneckiae]MBN6887278.1 hypothetical protein [Cytobacillus horneckiae]MCM3178129.1 hypothetical protein [Cytobacillus horneckiae]MEC1157133.1 hypothetical protein [Cytobacillus horneckiae]MED2939841.1 hypothetical protein [Cytobacillus horneckiae]PKG27412.1 hypothetical protein CWS20_18655 [Cytobacillus horneckiae]